MTTDTVPLRGGTPRALWTWLRRVATERASWGLAFWLLILGMFLFVAFAGALLTPFEAREPAPADRLLPPMTATPEGMHLFGTDALGRDLLSNILIGTRLTLMIGVTATAIGATIGITLGMLAGYYGGWADRLSMRLAEAQTAMPMFLVAILLLSLLGPSVINLLIVLPTLIWPAFARIVRAESLRLRETSFVEAAQAIGSSGRGLVRRHLLPNLVSRIIALLVIETGHIMLAEAGLSFLGVGVQPPDITWGLLISSGRDYLSVAWWMTIIPGLFLALVVLALNMVGRYIERGQGAAG